MSSSETDYLKHILDEIRYLQAQSADLDAATFQADPNLAACLRTQPGIIGEAAKHVSEPFRARWPAIPWRAIAGMRERVIHDYLGVDYEIVWDVVRNRVPALRDRVGTYPGRRGWASFQTVSSPHVLVLNDLGI